jgi:MFS family permease
MRRSWLLLVISVTFFLAFSYSVWGVQGLVSAALFSGIMAIAASSPRRAGIIFYFFIGFLAGFAIAIVIGVKTNASGWASALLMALPFIGAAIALLQGKKSDYQWWPLFGFRYRI